MQSDGQWKISQMSNAVLWRAGGFREMMQTAPVPKEAQSSNVFSIKRTHLETVNLPLGFVSAVSRVQESTAVRFLSAVRAARPTTC